jgi:hypothetical protein
MHDEILLKLLALSSPQLSIKQGKPELKMNCMEKVL